MLDDIEDSISRLGREGQSGGGLVELMGPLSHPKMDPKRRENNLKCLHMILGQERKIATFTGHPCLRVCAPFSRPHKATGRKVVPRGCEHHVALLKGCRTITGLFVITPKFEESSKNHPKAAYLGIQHNRTKLVALIGALIGGLGNTQC